MDESSGVGVIDKAVAITSTVAAAPASLAELAVRTGLPRPTAHRIALALEHHGVLRRDEQGRFAIGPTASTWAGADDALALTAHPAVVALRDATRESAQVYRRIGSRRLCIAAAEPATGLRDTVPIGALLTMQAGSAAQVLLAWLPPAARAEALSGAAFGEPELALVRERGWAHSVGQREPGVASLSAPVHDATGAVVAAMSVSGPMERLGVADPDTVQSLVHAADELARALR